MRPAHTLPILAAATLLLAGCPSDKCEELSPQAQIDINLAGTTGVHTLEVGLVVNEGAWAGRKSFAVEGASTITFVFQLRDQDRPPHKLTVNVDGLDQHGRTVARKSAPFFFKSNGCNWFTLDLGAITPVDFGPDIRRDAGRDGVSKKDGLKGEGGIPKKDGLKGEGGVPKKDGLKTEGLPKTDGAVKVDAIKIDAAKPDAPKPDAAKPDAAKPDAPKPDAAQSDAAQPDVTASLDLPRGEQHCDCLIEGSCYTSGATVGPCQTCVPLTSTTAPTWSTSCVATVAGAGSVGKADGAAHSATFNYPMGLFVDATTIYVADTFNNAIRTIKNGQVATLATGTLVGPQGLTLFKGKLYVADTGQHCIQEVTLAATPTMTTIAGTCTVTGSADGSGSNARFNGPDDIVGRPSTGSLLISDKINNAVRELTWDGSAWVTSTVPEDNVSLSNPSGLALKASSPERLFVSEWNAHVVRYTDAPFGNFLTLAGQYGAPGDADGNSLQGKLSYPRDISLDELTGDIYIADSSNHSIRRASSTGLLSTVAGISVAPGFADGAIGTAQLNEPRGIVAFRHPTASGGTQLCLYVADTANHRIRIIVP